MTENRESLGTCDYWGHNGYFQGATTPISHPENVDCLGWTPLPAAAGREADVQDPDARDAGHEDRVRGARAIEEFAAEMKTSQNREQEMNWKIAASLVLSAVAVALSIASCVISVSP